MRSLSASLLTLVLCLLTGACSTTAPQSVRYPSPPAALMEPPPPLLQLPPGDGPVPPAEALRVVVQNYETYHLVAARLAALQRWLGGLKGTP